MHIQKQNLNKGDCLWMSAKAVGTHLRLPNVPGNQDSPTFWRLHSHTGVFDTGSCPSFVKEKWQSYTHCTPGIKIYCVLERGECIFLL